MWSCNWELENFWITSGLKSGVQKVESTLFLQFFGHPDAQSNPVKHYATYVEALASFCNDLYYSFQYARYVKMAKSSFWLPSLEGPGLTFPKYLWKNFAVIWKV